MKGNKKLMKLRKDQQRDLKLIEQKANSLFETEKTKDHGLVIHSALFGKKEDIEEYLKTGCEEHEEILTYPDLGSKQVLDATLSLRFFV